MLYKRPVLIRLTQTLKFLKYIKNRIVVQILVSSHCMSSIFYLVFPVLRSSPRVSTRIALQLHYGLRRQRTPSGRLRGVIQASQVGVSPFLVRKAPAEHPVSLLLGGGGRGARAVPGFPVTTHSKSRATNKDIFSLGGGGAATRRTCIPFSF